MHQYKQDDQSAFNAINHTLLPAAKPRWKSRLTTVLLWSLALMIALGSAIYQRRTGPTYPFKGNMTINGATVSFSLLRSESVSHDMAVNISVPDQSITGWIKFRRFKSYDSWSIVPLERKGSTLSANLPRQPPAGKLSYYVLLNNGQQTYSLSGDDPVILRYKGDVPLAVLLPHILFMFLAMIVSNRTALEVLCKRPHAFNLMIWTIVFFCIGGMFLGPIIQKYAFGDFWTGLPFGHDLTDNKTIIAFFGWIAALALNLKNKKRPGWILVAAGLMLIIYLIPHSLLGSELDYTQTQP
ncbi:hypothetical protein JXQ70_12735 [bacterium]|nr:hypothetical protein [bacterium]